MNLVSNAINTEDTEVWKRIKVTQQDSSILPSCDEIYSKFEFESLEASFECYESSFENYNNIETFCDQYLGHYLETENSSHSENTGVELFQVLPIVQWDGEDCCDWAISVCRRRSLDSSEVNLWNFQNTTGSSMLQFSPEHFCLIAGNLHGSLFYQEFQGIRKNKKTGPEFLQNRNEEEELEHQNTWFMGGNKEEILSSSSFPSFISSSPSSSSSSCFSSASSICSFDSDSWELSKEEFEDLDRYIPQNEAWSDLPEDLLDMELKDYRNSEEEEEENTEKSDAEETLLDKKTSKKTHRGDEVTRGPTQKIKTKTRKGERNPKIWEFLMRLLVDEATNPELIRWNNKSKATFVLTKPAIIAQLWGARANKPNLSANNFARALRYHYSTGGLVAVSEKHYMYKCGPKSLKYLQELQRDNSSSSSEGVL